MKKRLLSALIAMLSLSSAQAAPEIYGKVFVSTDYVRAASDVTTTLAPNEQARVLDGYDETGLEISSHSSRIGFKGTEAITAGTDLVYKFEYGMSVDGDSSGFKSRDTYLGLDNTAFGEIRVGRNSSVLGEVNNVSVNEGYWDNLGDSTLQDQKELRALNMLDDSRQNNSIVWFAPKYKDVPAELALQYAADESSSDSQDGYGASLMFDPDSGMTAGLAYSKHMDMKGDINLLHPDHPDKKTKVNYSGDVIRGSFSADLSKYTRYPLTLGVMYQQADYDFIGAATEKGLIVSGEMSVESLAKPATLYMQYNKTDHLNGIHNASSDQIVLGGTYQLKQDITAHAYIGQNSADYIGAAKVDHITPDGEMTFDRYEQIESDISIFAFGAGLEYKF